MAEYGEFGDAAADVIRGGAALRPTTTATTVHVRGGKGGDLVVNDGPYAEAKEVLGGSTCWRPPTSMRQSAGRSRSRPVVPMSG